MTWHICAQKLVYQEKQRWWKLRNLRVLRQWVISVREWSSWSEWLWGRRAYCIHSKLTEPKSASLRKLGTLPSMVQRRRRDYGRFQLRRWGRRKRLWITPTTTHCRRWSWSTGGVAWGIAGRPMTLFVSLKTFSSFNVFVYFEKNVCCFLWVFFLLTVCFCLSHYKNVTSFCFSLNLIDNWFLQLSCY